MRVRTADGVDLKDIQPERDFWKRLFTEDGNLVYGHMGNHFAYPFASTQPGLHVRTLYSTQAAASARNDCREKHAGSPCSTSQNTPSGQ